MLSTSFTLETDRFRLRIPSAEDLPLIFSATRYPGFNDGMLWEPPDHPDEMIEPFEKTIKAWEMGEAYTFSIDDKKSGHFLGRIVIRPTATHQLWNVGFWTHPTAQGRGVMTEALSRVLEFGFTQLSAECIEACHAIWNKASERVLQKNGLQFVRYIEQGFQKKDQWVAENLLAIDRKSWQKKQQQGQLLEKILAKASADNLMEWLGKTLSGSELNSLLLAVFNKRTQAISPAELLRNYTDNRFVPPVPMDVLQFKTFELRVLEYVQQQGYELFETGPVAPIGTCSVLGAVDQKKVISALRNTEVVADVTNVMALEIAKRKKENPGLQTLQLSATHRHIRAQHFDIPGFTTHFKIISLVTAGRDTGNYHFESETLIKHINVYTGLLTEVLALDLSQLSLRAICLDEPRTQFLFPVWERIFAGINIAKTSLKIAAQNSNEYYRQFQFKIDLEHKGHTIEIIDGGRVNWTEQLLDNRKERLLISGMGLEFLYKLLEIEKSRAS